MGRHVPAEAAVQVRQSEGGTVGTAGDTRNCRKAEDSTHTHTAHKVQRPASAVLDQHRGPADHSPGSPAAVVSWVDPKSLVAAASPVSVRRQARQESVGQEADPFG